VELHALWARRGRVFRVRLRRAAGACLLAAVFVGGSVALLHAFRSEIPNRYDEDYGSLVSQMHLDPAVMARKVSSVVPYFLSRLVSVRNWGILWPLLGLLALLQPRVLARRAAAAAGALTVAPIGVGFVAFAVHWDPVALAQATIDRFFVQGSFGTFLLLGLLIAEGLRTPEAISARKVL